LGFVGSRGSGDAVAGDPGHEFPDRREQVTGPVPPGNSLVFEITEGLLMDARAAVNDQLVETRETGIQVALDDFGTGYSSMAYLQRFDIDYLKIDQSFVKELTAGSRNYAICKAIIVMAHELGMRVIAEGVETELQHRLLKDADCDFAQGYWLGRPVRPENFPGGEK
jgi:EAL domain-containing protein (putative c-di-GMP-specific phosphodiesterase class I)